MRQTIGFREVRVLLMLAEELHFGRAAKRLGLTQSRVSQSLRSLEQKLGRQLVHRTTRRVTLTSAGEQFRDLIGPAHENLASALRRASGTADDDQLECTLHLGLLVSNSGGPNLLEIIRLFEAGSAGCSVRISEMPFDDPFGPLRRGEIDVMATRLPLEQPDLEIGPVLSSEPRVLAMARDHPLAGRDTVTVEDIADYRVVRADGRPREMQEAWIPTRTGTGRPIRRLDEPTPATIGEVALLISRGKIVHPTVPSMVPHLADPHITFVEIVDMPWSKNALVWRQRPPNPKVRAFANVAERIARSAEPPLGPPP